MLFAASGDRINVVIRPIRGRNDFAWSNGWPGVRRGLRCDSGKRSESKKKRSEQAKPPKFEVFGVRSIGGRQSRPIVSLHPTGEIGPGFGVFPGDGGEGTSIFGSPPGSSGGG